MALLARQHGVAGVFAVLTRFDAFWIKQTYGWVFTHWNNGRRRLDRRRLGSARDTFNAPAALIAPPLIAPSPPAEHSSADYDKLLYRPSSSDVLDGVEYWESKRVDRT